jgi:molybdate transport system substrate-binding protein
MKHRKILLVFTLLFSLQAIFCGKPSNDNQQPAITVAAASDLGPVFEELGRLFEQSSGTKVVFSFGSTGMLAKQIEQGAPMDLFAAANVEFIDRLATKGLIIPETKALYARGQITLWTSEKSELKIEKIEDLALPQIKRIAIANPEHAPYGVAARDCMQAAGIWDEIQSKIVFAENIRQTLQFAETGNVDVAIVALSLSLQSKGRWKLIPQQMYKPIDQSLAVIKSTKHEKEAKEFANFINSPQGRPIMRKFGFILPGEEPLQ